MKKPFVLALAAAFVTAAAFAEESAPASGLSLESSAETSAESAEGASASSRPASAMWPAYFAIGEFPRSGDVIGLRITIPYSTVQENVTGVDLGFWGKALYFEGLQLNLLRNDARDTLAGFQVGLYNSVGRGELLGLQVGLWNEAMSLRGFQIGLVNVSGTAEGFQVGLINRAETMHGYQVGLVNVIRDAELAFFPILNIGF